MLVPLQQQIKQQQRKWLLVSGGAESAAVSPKRLRLAAAWARGAEGHEHGANGTAAAKPLPACSRCWGTLSTLPAWWHLAALQSVGYRSPSTVW